MKGINKSMWVGGLALTVGLVGCVSMPVAQQAGMERLDALVRGNEAMQRSNLTLAINDTTGAQAGGQAGYKVAYVNVLDWDLARATLDKVITDGATGWMTDAGFTAKTSDRAVSVSSSNLARSAVITLSNLSAGDNYRIKVQLIKVVNGVEKVVAEGVNADTDGSGFVINSGSNAIDVTLNLTANGKAIINVPLPGVSTTLSTTVNAQSHFSAIRYAGATLNGTTAAIPPTTAATSLATTTLDEPNGLEIDESGNLYVADTGHHQILKMDGTNTTVYGGTGTNSSTGDGGAATAATFNEPRGLAYVPSKKALYIAEYTGDRIRMIDETGKAYTVAGGGANAVSATPIDALTAQLNGPTAVAIDSVGNVYFTETLNSRVCKVDLDGKISTVATGITGATALAIDRTNKVLWVGANNTIRKITAFDTTPVLAPTAVHTFPDASYDRCFALAYDHNGTLYAARSYSAGVSDRRYANSVYRFPVATSGSIDTGKNPEVVAGVIASGTGYDAGTTPFGSAPTTSVSNARSIGFAGIGYNGLLLDMNNAASAADQSGILYFSQWNYTSRKGEIVKLTPSNL
jgi:sugar lactone lactonase YvrE